MEEKRIFTAYLNQFRAQLGGDNIAADAARLFLKNRSHLLDIPAGRIVDMDNVQQKQVLSQMIWVLAQGDIAGAKELLTLYAVDGRYLTEAAVIAFDVSLAAVKPKQVYSLLNHFLLDQDRMTAGILLFTQYLIKSNKLEEASDVLMRSHGNLDAGKARETGQRLFRDAMTFRKTVIHRDYHSAMGIADMFQLDYNTTYDLASQEYDFNMYHRRHESAAQLGKFFNLGSVKTKEAAFKAFEQYIRKFRELLESGHYEDSLTPTTTDPYVRAVQILNEYMQPSPQVALDDAGRLYLLKVTDIAFFLAKKLTAQPKGQNMGFLTRAYFAAYIIHDFRLDVSDTEERLQQTNTMIGWVAEHIQINMQDMDQTPRYRHCVQTLHQLFSSYKPVLQKVGLRMFRYYLRENDLNTAYALYDNMQLPRKDVLELLQNRALIWLARQQHTRFQEMIELFKMSEEVRANKEMQSRLLEHYTKDIQQHHWESVTIIQSIMQFPRKKIIQTTSRLVQTAMMREKDDEALDLLGRFALTVQSIRSIFVQSYRVRAAKHWTAGKYFRQVYHLTPLDVGVLAWLTHEVFQAERWKFQKIADNARDTS